MAGAIQSPYFCLPRRVQLVICLTTGRSHCARNSDVTAFGQLLVTDNFVLICVSMTLWYLSLSAYHYMIYVSLHF